MASTTVASGQSSNDARTIVAESTIHSLLDALADADCRAILDATSDKVLTASEIAETCDLPLSTTYRKLDILTEAGLLEERTRIRRSGKHASEYARLVDDVVVPLSPRGETQVRVSQRTNADRTGSSVPTTED